MLMQAQDGKQNKLKEMLIHNKKMFFVKSKRWKKSHFGKQKNVKRLFSKRLIKNLLRANVSIQKIKYLKK